MDDAKKLFGNIGKGIAFIPAAALGLSIKIIGEVIGEDEKGSEIGRKVINTTMEIGKQCGEALPTAAMVYLGKRAADKHAENKKKKIS